LKHISAYVYRAARFSDSTNGGVTSKADVVMLVWDDEPGAVMPTPRTEAVALLRLVKRRIFGQDYMHAEPIDKPEGMVGPMFGGNYTASSDSRFPSRYPIPVHDRFETAAQYDLLSR
jgi:hypothetical protein